MPNTPDIKLIHGDCLELLKEIPNSSVDCVITDPPYSVLNKSNPHAVWDRPFDMEAWWSEMWRVCKRNAAVISFGQGMFFHRENRCKWLQLQPLNISKLA